MRKSQKSAKETAKLLTYWKEAVGEYIRTKRAESRKGQKQMKVRQTTSLVERGKSNFRLSTLLRELQAVNGDISEAFRSHVPKSFHGEHQGDHELLAKILSSKDDEAIHDVTKAIRRAYKEFIEHDNSPDKDR